MNMSTSEFLQNILDLSRNKEKEFHNGTVKLVLTPHDVQYLQNLLERGLAQNRRLSFILTPNDIESIRKMLSSIIYFQIISRKSLSAGAINFKFFTSLQNLELDRIKPSQLIELESLRPQLKTLKCNRSLTCLKDILRGFQQNLERVFWVSLKHLDISFNSLEYFDDSLSLLSRLEVLNASHNKIKTSECLKLLKGVSILNLCYNKLVEFPSLSAETCTNLKVLVLKYNFLENLTGIQYLVQLSELDMAYNLLDSHDVLVPLKELNNLIMLKLEGNPLAFHKNHRVLTAAHLNNFSLKKLLLDGSYFSTSEIKESHLVILQISHSPVRRSNRTPSVVDSFFEPGMLGSLNYQEDASVSSFNSDYQSLVDEPIAKGFRKKKSKRLREVLISEPVCESTPEEHVAPQTDFSESDQPVESHFETKKLIQDTRKELGPGWLLSASNFLGSYGEPFTASYHSQISGTESTHLKESARNCSDGTNEQSSELHVSPENKGVTPSSATESISELILHSSSQGRRSSDSFEEDFFLNAKESTSQVPKRSLTFDKSSDHSDSSSESYDDTESESNLFIVQRFLEEKEIELILSVGSEFISEKDGLTGKHLHTWNLKNLVSAQEIQEDERIFIQLEFDVIRKDKQYRTYFIEDSGTSQMLLSLLESHVESKNAKTSQDGLIQCLKCNFKFSSNSADKIVVETNSSNVKVVKEVNICPKCKSTLLVMLNSDSKVQNPEAETKSSQFESSPNTSTSKIQDFFQSLSSVELSNSLGKSPSSRPRSISSELQEQRKAISLSPSHLDQQAQAAESTSSSSVDCISLNADENIMINNSQLVFDRASCRRSESDITVLSNPSQSSIAVISTTSSSVEQGQAQGGLEVIFEQELFSNMYPSLSIYDSLSNDTFHSANLNSPVAKLKEVAKNENSLGLNSSSDISWYDSASAETFIQLPLDSSKRTKTPDELLLGKAKESTIDENVEMEAQSKCLWEEFEEPCAISSDEFMQIDHRLRLYLEMEVFEDDEELLAAIKGFIYLSSDNNFNGMMVFTNRNVYLFQSNVERPQLTNIYSYTIKSLCSARTLLGSQGIIFNHSSTSYAINLGYADLCNSFVSHLEDSLKSQIGLSNVSFEHSTVKDLSNVKNEILMSDLISNASDDTSVEVKIFLFANLLGKGLAGESQQVAVVLTENSLSLAEVQYFLQNEKSDIHFVLMDKQQISNLTSMHISKNMRTISFHFLDEDYNAESYWVLETQSKSSLASLLTSLRRPWENIFGIQLQLAIVPSCTSCGLRD